MFNSFFGAALLLAFGANALPPPLVPLDQSLVERQSCSNTATSRSCWGNGYDINTNWYEKWPSTGVVREYWLDVQNGTTALDGYERVVLTFNGTFPGPTLYADWGDTLRIHVTNSMQVNGTSVHWHGIRQLLSNEQDGVNGVTECPLAPGESLTYEWNATQYGTTWYHSHFSLQYAEGVIGTMVIRGPASADYDVDLEPIVITDWYHNTAFSLWESARTNPNPPANNGLINGTNVYDCSKSTDAACVGGGKRWETTFEKGKKYRLRFINTAVDTFFKLALDNHTFTVIAADLVPVKPFTTTYLNIGIGQRYDVIVEANQAVDNYWFRAYVQTSCSTNNEQTMGIKGIIRYSGAATADPTTTDSMDGYVDSCIDVPLSDLVPVVAIDVPSTDFTKNNKELGVDVTVTNGIFKWLIQGTSVVIDWAKPSLYELINSGNSTNSSSIYPASYNTVQLTEANQWVFFVVESSIGIPHPIHLHGHDFHILGQDTGTFNGSTTALNFVNPMRRDVAMLPAAGHLVIGFQTDNPGIWLMHCHIAWHVSGGLAIQFVERQSEILSSITIDKSWTDTCDSWSKYSDNMLWPQDDSGLKRAKRNRIEHEL